MTLIIILCARWILFPNLNYSDRRNPVDSLVEHSIFADANDRDCLRFLWINDIKEKTQRLSF